MTGNAAALLLEYMNSPPAENINPERLIDDKVTRKANQFAIGCPWKVLSIATKTLC